MKPSRSNSIRITVLLAVLAAGLVLAGRLHKHTNDSQELVALLSALLASFALAAELLWMSWLSKREIFARTLVTSLFGFAAFADLMKGERLPAVGFGAVFVFGAILVLRKLARGSHTRDDRQVARPSESQ